MEQVELVMPGKTRPARHERVVTIADGVRGDVAEIRSRSNCRLLRHLDRFISREEDELRTIDVVRFDQNAIPGWRTRGGGERRNPRNVVLRSSPIDQIAVALTKPCAVRSVLGDNLDRRGAPAGRHSN
jgi:hypothetical protein